MKTSGDSIGPYRLERPLGKGGMGEVWLAVNGRLGRKVALKRIAARGGGAALAERLRREARASAALSHSAVVQIHDLIEEGDDLSLVFELVEGETVAQRLASGPLPFPLALAVARDVAAGLAAAHEAGLIHRDLKAENVMITRDGRAKILDFGLSRLESSGDDDPTLTAAGTLVGTFRAMSPEQARGGTVDSRSDLFSLGVLLYEMSSGRSPFRGAHAAETVARVLAATPEPLARLAPSLPAAWTELVAKLLARDPADRPRAAHEVAEALDRLTAPASRSRRRWVRWAIGAILAAGLAAGISLWLKPPEARRVLVLPPQVDGAGDADDAGDDDDEPLALAASGVFSSSLGALAALDGLSPLDATDFGEKSGTPPLLAARTAADEILRSNLRRDGGMAHVTLSRLAGTDGRVLWTETFEVPLAARDLRLVAEAVALHVRGGFPRHRPRSPQLGEEARAADYAAFLEVLVRLHGGQVATAADLARLEAILDSSPRLLSARLLAAEVALAVFRSSRRPAALDRAAAHLAAAERQAADDPRRLALAIEVALAHGRPAEARAQLTRLERRNPGAPELLLRRAEIAEAEGQTAEALAALREAGRRAPSWQNLYRLADLAARTGHVPEARARLGELLARSPGNPRLLEKWGEMELLYGDLARAAEIYRDLAAAAPRRAYWTNLGLARFLAGDAAGAVTAYERALAIDPGHTAVTLNLADALDALGRQTEAAARYTEVLGGLGRLAAKAPLTAIDRMTRAQCLAHLGQSRAAIEATQGALLENPRHPEVVYQAALVYALAGERTSALILARQAIELGIQPRWLAIPAFGALRRDPEWPSAAA